MIITAILLGSLQIIIMMMMMTGTSYLESVFKEKTVWYTRKLLTGQRVHGIKGNTGLKQDCFLYNHYRDGTQLF